VTLYGAVQTYIDGKHARGVVFEEATKILRSFSKKIGDVPLDTITPAQILDFLNGPRRFLRHLVHEIQSSQILIGLLRRA
jgi:hypothetical protein